MRNYRLGILIVLLVMVLVSVASAALPSSITAYVTYPGSSSYFDLHVVTTTGGDDTDLAPLTTYNNAWCADTENTIVPGSSHVYTFNVISSIPQPYPVTSPVVNWQAVNYVINNKGIMNKYTIQRVIWYYDGDPDYVWGSPDMTQVNAKIVETNTFIGSYPAWYPTYCGQHYAVILDNPGTAQLIMVELPLPTCVPPPNVPEFPTVALPIGMMIGIVGLVYVIKGREK